MANDTSRRRRLTDLYRKGRLLTLDDDRNDPIAIYIKKMAPFEQKIALEKANAAKARVLAAKFGQKGSDERLSFLAQADSQGLADREQMIELLSEVELNKKRMSHEAELASEKYWSENNFLEGLLSEWQDGLEDKYAEDPEDPDASRVFAELSKFRDEVGKRVEKDRKAFKRDYASDSDETLREKVINVLIEQESDSVWMNEFRKQQIFYSTRDPEDHDKRYFADRSEIDQCEMEVLRQISVAIDDLEVDSIEGKDSGATPSSSD